MMQENTVLYKDIDRIIRIVYKELSFSDHLHYSYFHKESYSKGERDSFDLANIIFRTRIKKDYMRLYPNNYNADDLDCILELVTQQLQDNYNSSNTMYLIFLVADTIIRQGLDGIYINFDDLLEWDGFINKIDIKLFIAAYMVSNEIEGTQSLLMSTLNHNNKYLYDIFKRIGLSENHMHLKASGYISEINWYCFIQCSLFEKNKYTEFIQTEGIYSSIAKSDKNVSALVEYILKFKVIRLVLEARIDELLVNDEGQMLHFISTVLMSTDVLQTVTDFNDDFDLDQLTEILNESRFKLENENQMTDYAAFELDFLKEMMLLLTSNNRSKFKQVLLSLFNLYICGMTDLKFQFIQDNLGMGFAKFKEKEENKSWFIEGRQHKNSVIRSVFHKYYSEKYIKKIEFRIGPENNSDDYLNELRKMNELNLVEHSIVKDFSAKMGLSEPQLIKFGVIIHFIKIRQVTGDSPICVEEGKRELLESQTNMLLETLIRIKQLESEDRNFLKNSIVGIDTANYELENRPTLYSLYFRKIRKLAENGEALSATYHVGEEFSTISNGLRAVDEVLTFCDYRANDRLGHALALGIDVTDYYEKKRKKIMCSIGDYLDDLVWMYAVLVEDNPKVKGNQLLFLKKEYDRYAHLLFKQNENVSFDDYLAFYFLRGDCPDVHHIIYIKQMTYQTACKDFSYKLNYTNRWHESSFMNETARILYSTYSSLKDFREAFNQPIGLIASPAFVNCLEKVQLLIRKKILKMRVFVESNPSSNKKISYVDQYIKLPSLNLNRQHLERDGDDRLTDIPISINTDDSSIFQTNLTNEYSLVAAALIREGYSDEAVYQYIEGLAIASNVHSFIK